MTQSGTDQHECRISIRKCAYHSRPASDLTIQALNDIAGSDLQPVFGREIHVRQRFFHAVAHLFHCFFQLHIPKFFGNSFCLLSGNIFVLLRMNRFKHQSHILYLCPRYHRKHIAIKVNNAALIPGFREDFTSSFEHSKALVAHNELDTIQSAAAQPLKERFPALLIFLHTFGCAKNLTISVFIDCNGHKNSHVLIFTSPVPFQIDAIHIHIRILPAFKRPVPPLLNMFVLSFRNGV